MTDFWDQRCLSAILRRFFQPATLQPDYKYSPSGLYFAPPYESLEEYREYIEELPLLEPPEVFGMHENANIAAKLQETGTFMSTIIDIQPRAVGGKGGKSTDEIVNEVADTILGKVMDKVDTEQAKPDLFDVSTSAFA